MPKKSSTKIGGIKFLSNPTEEDQTLCEWRNRRYNTGDVPNKNCHICKYEIGSNEYNYCEKHNQNPEKYNMRTQQLLYPGLLRGHLQDGPYDTPENQEGEIQSGIRHNSLIRPSKYYNMSDGGSAKTYSKKNYTAAGKRQSRNYNKSKKRSSKKNRKSKSRKNRKSRKRN